MLNDRTDRVAGEQPSGRSTRARQRQRLIDACISALYLYGPSRTTVEKVVGIAELSPGIVRFYFDSKAAMLVAALQYLADEFEQRVQVPVAQLRTTPVLALRLLVDLYLDPEIASPRKVSVWYSFWGEASSRQEYYEICGRKDEDFAVLVRDLIGRLIVQAGATHLDRDAVALGFIGALEVLWQTIAFQSESSVDRARARAQCLDFLRSVFPGEFSDEAARAKAAIDSGTVSPAEPESDDGAMPLEPGAGAIVSVATITKGPDAPVHLPAWAYDDARLATLERDRLLRPAFQLVGHEVEIPHAGDYLSAELAGERVLVLRDERGRLRAFRNACRQRPHALTEASHGHFGDAIRCSAHGLAYRLDGRHFAGDTAGDLTALEIIRRGPLILVRAAGAVAEVPMTWSDPAPASGAAAIAWDAFDRLASVSRDQYEVGANWKLIVERWLETASAGRVFLAPNGWLELRRDEALILQVIPQGPAHCRLQRFNFAPIASETRSDRPHAVASRTPERHRRELEAWLEREIALAESTQLGLADDAVEDTGSVAPAVAAFRRQIAAWLPR